MPSIELEIKRVLEEESNASLKKRKKELKAEAKAEVEAFIRAIQAESQETLLAKGLTPKITREIREKLRMEIMVEMERELFPKTRKNVMEELEESKENENEMRIEIGKENMRLTEPLGETQTNWNFKYINKESIEGIQGYNLRNGLKTPLKYRRMSLGTQKIESAKHRIEFSEEFQKEMVRREGL